jgi:integrase
MKAIKDKRTGKWKFYIPPALTGTGRRQYQSFDTKAQAEAKIRLIRERGLDPAGGVQSDDFALLALIKKQFGNNAAEVIRNLDFARRTIGNIPPEKRVDLETACNAFIERQEREERNIRTIYSDRQALKYLCAFAGEKSPVTELTEAKINEYFDTMKPGGRRRTQYKNVKKFVNWCCGEGGYLVINPMARLKPRDRWNSNKEILDIEVFRRILFVVAGLEPINPGEAPTVRYQRLLPFYVLGGLGGLRRCEIIRSYPTRPVVAWTDIRWDKNLIVIRDAVAKQTGTETTDHLRYVPLEPSAKEWLKTSAQPSGPVMNISQSTLQRLNDELLDALKVKVPENALRNSYASYGQSIRSLGDVARAMGDLESTVKRFYVETLEPGDGEAWFGIRPGVCRRILPMHDSASYASV